MERVWKLLGHRPSRYEWKKNNPKVHYNTYKRRFGGWQNACLRFIEYKMGKAIVIEDVKKPIKKQTKRIKRKTVGSSKRDVSLSMRVKILKRDNYRCVICGKSPATDLGIELHIDHIVPFSKGGKTEFDNLRTLCNKCNLGRSNKLDL